MEEPHDIRFCLAVDKHIDDLRNFHEHYPNYAPTITIMVNTKGGIKVVAAPGMDMKACRKMLELTGEASLDWVEEKTK